MTTGSRTARIALGVAAGVALLSATAWGFAGAPGAPAWMRNGAGMHHDASGHGAMHGGTHDDGHEGMRGGAGDAATDAACEGCPAEGATIAMEGGRFTPRTLTVRVGDTVTWVNRDGHAHTVTSDAGDELDSGSIAAGASWSHAFTRPGTYRYHCEPHAWKGGDGAYQGMAGTIVVE